MVMLLAPQRTARIVSTRRCHGPRESGAPSAPTHPDRFEGKINRRDRIPDPERPPRSGRNVPAPLPLPRPGAPAASRVLGPTTCLPEGAADDTLRVSPPKSSAVRLASSNVPSGAISPLNRNVWSKMAAEPPLVLEQGGLRSDQFVAEPISLPGPGPRPSVNVARPRGHRFQQAATRPADIIAQEGKAPPAPCGLATKLPAIRPMVGQLPIKMTYRITPREQCRSGFRRGGRPSARVRCRLGRRGFDLPGSILRLSGRVEGRRRTLTRFQLLGQAPIGHEGFTESLTMMFRGFKSRWITPGCAQSRWFGKRLRSGAAGRGRPRWSASGDTPQSLLQGSGRVRTS